MAKCFEHTRTDITRQHKTQSLILTDTKKTDDYYV